MLNHKILIKNHLSSSFYFMMNLLFIAHSLQFLKVSPIKKLKESFIIYKKKLVSTQLKKISFYFRMNLSFIIHQCRTSTYSVLLVHFVLDFIRYRLLLIMGSVLKFLVFLRSLIFSFVFNIMGSGIISEYNLTLNNSICTYTGKVLNIKDGVAFAFSHTYTDNMAKVGAINPFIKNKGYVGGVCTNNKNNLFENVHIIPSHFQCLNKGNPKSDILSKSTLKTPEAENVFGGVLLRLPRHCTVFVSPLKIHHILKRGIHYTTRIVNTSHLGSPRTFTFLLPQIKYNHTIRRSISIAKIILDTLPLLGIIFVSSIFVCFFGILYIVFQVYVKRDHILPIIMLSTPFFLILIWKPFDSWFQNILVLLIYHCIFLIPFFNCQKKYYYHLYSDLNKTLKKKMYTIKFYEQLNLALIYPLIWGAYFSLIRFLRLGSSLNLFDILSNLPQEIILIPFLFPHLILWCWYFIIVSSNLRSFLWFYTEIIVYQFHIKALQIYTYFYVCKVIHKIYFIIFDLIFQHPGAFYKHFDDSEKTPIFIKIMRIIQNLYYKPYIIPACIFLFLFLEIIISKGIIFYGLYILFIYPLFISFLRIIQTVGLQDLVLNMCLSDYKYYNFKNPRYYLNFWFYANNTDLWYGFTHMLDISSTNLIEKTAFLEEKAFTNFTRFHIKLPYRIHGYKRTNISIFNTTFPRKYGDKIGHAHPWPVRIAALYKCEYGVRWYHTTRILHYPLRPHCPIKPIHPMTGKYVRNIYEIIALFNASPAPGSYSLLEQYAQKRINWSEADYLYEDHPNIKSEKIMSAGSFLEANLVQRLKFLADKGVVIGTYYPMKKIYGYDNLDAMQQRPDFLSYWANNTAYAYKGYIGLDEKYYKPENLTESFGRNMVVNNITAQQHIIILNHFRRQLAKKSRVTAEQDEVLEQLKDVTNSDNFNTLLDLWSHSLPLFPPKMKPALRIIGGFDTSPVKEENHLKISEAAYTVQKISDRLYELNVPPVKETSPETYIMDSWLQKIS